MKNALLFFYNININTDSLTKMNDNYYFNYQKSNFIVAKYQRNIDEITEIYNLSLEMINNNIPLYRIILTKENNILFDYEGNYYVLMILPNIKNRVITFADIIKFNYVPVNNRYQKIDKSHWTYHWEQKIDYLEYQFSQIGKKYPLIKMSINYYLGIWENAISYYNDNIINEDSLKFVSHKRISIKSDLLSFLNPLELVIDYKERDIADYIKSYVYEENYTEEMIYSFLDKVTVQNDAIVRFISRIMFPSKYFDVYESIVYDNYDEQFLNEILSKRKSYDFLIRIVFEYYKRYNVPLIEWVMKDD